MTDTNKKIHICPILQILWYAKKNPVCLVHCIFLVLLVLSEVLKKKINVHVHIYGSLYSNVLERVWNYQKVLGTMFKLEFNMSLCNVFCRNVFNKTVYYTAHNDCNHLVFGCPTCSMFVVFGN